MVNDLRNAYNQAFSEAKYNDFLQSINDDFPGQLDFRVAETPVFVSKDLGDKIIEVCEAIIDVITGPFFKEKTQNAIPAGQNVPNENAHSSFLAIDFAVCQDQNGQLVPQLIELQGFPSVFGFQSLISEKYREHFPVPSDYQNYFGVQNQAEYFDQLRAVVVGNENPENVILLDIYPDQQKTRIDFAVTAHFLGIETVCLTQIKKEGRAIFYEKDGRKIPITRIYNRLIFDDLTNFPTLTTEFSLTDDVDVTWVGHPNWFFRISKYTMPFLKHAYIPEAKFLSEYDGVFPEDLQNFVLKPLFSFAGSGVNLHPTPQDLLSISDPENFILQRKVTYQPVVQAPDGLVKCEIRMLYVWPEGQPRPKLLTNLARLSRGEMIGVRFNKDFTWVGGTTCFFEK